MIAIQKPFPRERFLLETAVVGVWGSALAGDGSTSTAGRTGEVTDVGVDRAIEERVIADARSGEGENLLSQKAEKEI